MSQHVLFRESVSISPRFTADYSIMHQWARLTESLLSLTRRFHPHDLEAFTFRSGEFRQDLNELEFSQTWTVSEICVKPWISSSSSMDVDEDVMVSHGESAKTVVVIKQGKILLK